MIGMTSVRSAGLTDVLREGVDSIGAVLAYAPNR
jgi:hypothetical protein